MALKMLIAGPGSGPPTKAAPGKGVATTSTVRPPPPPAAAPTTTPDYNTLMAQAARQASALATAQIAAQIKAITDQQDQLRANASAQAQQINDASLAAAQFLSNLGDKAQADYGAAVNNLTGMTQGFTGSLRDSAQQAADAAQAQLSGIAGNTQTIQNRGPDLANLLYGVSGYIPANALQVQGLGAVENARAIPAQTIGYGQSQAAGTLASGNTSADALNSQINTIRASLPSTTATYLNQFQTQAQNAITNARNVAQDARQATNDYYSRLNTLSQIDARTTAALNAKAAAKRAGRALTLREELAQPHFDMSQSRDGIMRDQYGTVLTSAPDKNGVKHYLLLPGYTWQNGAPTAPAKPLTAYQQTAAAARFTEINHYQTDYQNRPILGPPDAAGHRRLQPVGNWQINPADPTGHSVMPVPKPTKPFVPKPIEVNGNYAYVGQDKGIHYFLQPDGSKVPWPTKPGALHVLNSGGWFVIVHPDGTITRAVDENGNNLPAGTPKAPPTPHWGNRFPDATTGHWFVVNSLTGETKDTGHAAPRKLIEAAKVRPQIIGNSKIGVWAWFPNGTKKLIIPASPIPQQVHFVGSDKEGKWIIRISQNGKVTKTLLIDPVKGAAGGGLTPGETQTQMNTVSSQLAAWTAAVKARYIWDPASRTFRQTPGTGAAAVITVPKAGGGTQQITVPGNAPLPFNYQDAMTWALNTAPKDAQSQAQARRWVNFYYPIGYAGHYMEGKAAIAHATTALKIMKRQGDSPELAARKAINSGLYDPAIVPGLVRNVFGSVTTNPWLHSPAAGIG